MGYSLEGNVLQMATAEHLKLQFSVPELFILIGPCDLPGW